ncbi:MAG: hypothetical protein OIN86_15225 [Candidatus Methanoperedens sp.]|nr:hypothetical protein [Candidatus Methanoperedens sp.]CAG0974508.1 hypothetical protein METP1_01429 [Methanosarcinales archaeon]
MKWIYVLIVLMIAASTSGCVDKNLAGTKTPAQTSVSPGEAVVTPGAVLTPAASGSSPAVTPEDLFGTESNLSALDTTFNDMNMEISLVDSI